MTPDRIRTYLLGGLTPEERQQIDDRTFTDDAFESEVEEAEADLLDDWARGKLAPADAARVRNRYPEHRRRTASLLARHVGAPARPAARMRRYWWIAAAILVVGLAPLILRLRPSQPALQHPHPAVAPQPKPIVLALTIPTTRGSTPPVFTLAGPDAEIKLTAPAVPGYREFELRLESGDRGIVFTREVTSEGGELAAVCSAAALPDGNYDLVISGRKGGAMELASVYSFRIRR